MSSFARTLPAERTHASTIASGPFHDLGTHLRGLVAAVPALVVADREEIDELLADRRTVIERLAIRARSPFVIGGASVSAAQSSSCWDSWAMVAAAERG